MYVRDPTQITSNNKLEQLLRDGDLLKVIELVSREVVRFWNMPSHVAHGLVISAIGEPATTTQIYDAWQAAKQTGKSLGLPKVMIRRRVIDLLRKDARPATHCSLTTRTDGARVTHDAPSFDDLVQRSPQTQLELRQLIDLVRTALACFATQGKAQYRQAELLRRHVLDEDSYSELSEDLGCSEAALRVRVHKAIMALRKHIHECHGELEHVLGLGPRRGSVLTSGGELRIATLSSH
jgi:hypothetical protein